MSKQEWSKDGIVSELRRIATAITAGPDDEPLDIEVDGKNFSLTGQRRVDVGCGVALAAKLIQQGV